MYIESDASCPRRARQPHPRAEDTHSAGAGTRVQQAGHGPSPSGLVGGMRPVKGRDNCWWWLVPRRKRNQGKAVPRGGAGGRALSGRWSQ